MDRAPPSAIGPYRIVDELGRGGMGVVYRGEHRETGQSAAIKTIPSARQTTLAGLRREIHALSRIRHPGVVRILEQGVAAGLPWYAMELLQGRTLRAYLDELWSRQRPASGSSHSTTSVHGTGDTPMAPSGSGGAAPAPSASPVLSLAALRPVLGLVRDLCAALTFLHGHGLVHRDLKPDNIILRPDGMPVLVDFGLLTQFGGMRGREELVAEGQIVGTISYMAPEQIRAELVDARADLYALGCILYECLTGRAPFTAPTTGMVLFQHLNTPPEPPSARNPAVPPELDRLLLKLLQKQPQARLGYADDVAEVLHELGATGLAPASIPGGRAYLYRPMLVGRDEVLRELTEALGAMGRRKRGGLYFIGGESGVGKTRLAVEVAATANQQDLQVVTGQCVALGVERGTGAEHGMAAPLHPLRPLLLAVADRCREGGAMHTHRLLGPRARVLMPYEPSLATLPGLDAEPELPALEPMAARERVLTALREALLAFAGERPVLLILDDLQWADELTLAFLASLAREGLAAHPVLVMGTYRMEELQGALADMLHAPGARGLELHRLGGDSVKTMVSGMLSLPEPPAALIDFLVHHTNGNPFFVAEYLQAAIGERLLTRDRSSGWRLQERGEQPATLQSLLPLPGTLEELIQRRLLDLGAQGHGLVQWAAVLGRELDSDVLAASSGLDDTALLETLETLRIRQILEEPRAGRLRFVHDKLREIAYESIPEDHRRELHRCAAEALEPRVADIPSAAPELALHFSKAGRPDRAGLYFARAAEHARVAYANSEALAYYQSAIDAVRKHRDAGGATPGAEEEARLHEGLGDLLTVLGRQDEARAAYGEAIACLPEHARVERARLHRRVGKAWETHHRHDEALRFYELAEAALGGMPLEQGPEGAERWREWIQIQMERTWVYYWLARVADLAPLIEKVRPVIEEKGTSLQRAHFFQSLIHMELRRERHAASDRMVEYAHASMAASEESGNPNEVCGARFALGFTLLFHGSLAQAEQALRTALGEAERMGDVPLQSRCLTYLMMAARKQGQVEQTRALAERTLAMATAGKMMDYLGAAHANLGWAALRDGSPERAASSLTAALETWRSQAYVYPFQWMALLPLLSLELERGRDAEAAACAAAALEPQQQRLPDALRSPLDEAARRHREGQAPLASEHLRAAVTAARQSGYL